MGFPTPAAYWDWLGFQVSCFGLGRPPSTKTRNPATLPFVGWTKVKKAGVGVAAILLAAGIATIIVTVRNGSIGKGGLKLAVGQGTPAISLGERHGLILASDGSLWYRSLTP